MDLPDGLTARITLKNCSGPGRRSARDRESAADPGSPPCEGSRDYRFSDPQKAKETYSDEVPAATTDAAGEARFNLGWSGLPEHLFACASSAKGTRPRAGRGVTAEAGAVVSNSRFSSATNRMGICAICTKTASAQWNSSWSSRRQEARCPQAASRAHPASATCPYSPASFDGTYKYQSVKKEIPVSDAPLAIAATGLSVPLPTAEPGDFALVVRDSAATELSRVEYNVAGAANLARSLERNAELQLTLDKGTTPRARPSSSRSRRPTPAPA